MTVTVGPLPGYTFGITCPRCGNDMVHETSSKPTDTNTRATAVAICAKRGCRRRWQIVTRIAPFAEED